MQFDLVLKGGHLIDPQNGIDAPKDLGIKGKTIAAVDADLPTEGAGQIIDVSGLYVDAGASGTSTSTPMPRPVTAIRGLATTASCPTALVFAPE